MSHILCVIWFQDLRRSWISHIFPLSFVPEVPSNTRIFVFARKSLHTDSIGRIPRDSPCFTYLYYVLWVLYFPCLLPSWYLSFLFLVASISFFVLYIIFKTSSSFMVFSKFVGRSSYLSLQISLGLYKSLHHQWDIDIR